MCETFNAVNKKFEEEDAASEDVDIICNSVLLLLIHMKTLRIVWGSDEAVREEQKPTIAGLAVDGCGDAQTSQKRRTAKPASVSPPKRPTCAPQSHAGRWLSSQKRAARGHSHRSGG